MDLSDLFTWNTKQARGLKQPGTSRPQPAQALASRAAVAALYLGKLLLGPARLTPSRPPRCLCTRWRSGQRPQTM